MNAIIIYSSKTGNTKKMAEFIYNNIKDIVYTDLLSIKDIKDIENLKKYDLILLGGWINRATLNKEAIHLLKKIKNKNIGLFATLGAMPESEHGQKVINNLKNLLVDKNSLGQYICPGLVDPKMIEKLQGITAIIMPKKLRQKMIDTSLKSRYATNEELEKAGQYFKEKIEKMKK